MGRRKKAPPPQPKVELPKRNRLFSMSRVPEEAKINEKLAKDYIGKTVVNSYEGGTYRCIIKKVYKENDVLLVDAFDSDKRTRTFFAKDCKLLNIKKRGKKMV
jgi:hypothetical protein